MIAFDINAQVAPGVSKLHSIHTRFFRRDNPSSRPFFQKFYKWKVVKTRLLPLLVAVEHDKFVPSFEVIMSHSFSFILMIFGRRMVFSIMKLLVMLTMPRDPNAEIVEGNEVSYQIIVGDSNN